MAQYPVPQFIERETRLLGPLTGRQLIIFGVVAFILFVLYFLVPTFVLVLIGTILVTGAVSLAFIKVNNRPLADALFSFLNYFFKPRVYLWQRKELSEKEMQKKTEEVVKKAYPNKEKKAEAVEEEVPVNEEKIKNLADLLNE